MWSERKQELRRTAREIRDGMDAGEREKASLIICDLLMRSIRPSATGVFIYASFGSEVETWTAMKYLMKQGIDVCLPRLADPGKMEAVQWDGTAKLVKNKFGIEEPPGGAYEKKIDHIIVPGLAFDGRGGRIGYGAGYYDRWIADHKEVSRIGLSYDEQLVERIPMEPWDFRINALVTQSGVRAFE